MAENQPVKGCGVVERLQLSMFREPEHLLPVMISLDGRVSSPKGTIALGRAPGNWSRAFVSGRVRGKTGTIPQLRGQLRIAQISTEQLLSTVA